MPKDIQKEIQNGTNAPKTLDRSRLLDSHTSSKNTPEREGYYFAGWYVDPELTRPVNPAGLLPDTMQLYPSWKPLSYNIIYELDEGMNSPLNPHSYTVESGLLKLYPAQCEGKLFTGWLLDGELIEYIDPSWMRRIRLKGTFDALVEISFDSCGGSRVAPVKTDGAGRIHPPFSPIRIGHRFTGWYLDPACHRAWNPSMRFAKPTTLYAGWKEEEYEIRLDPDKGVLDVDPVLSYSINTPSFTLPVPRRKGWSFGGWYDERGNICLMVRKGMSGNRNLHALWVPESEESLHVPGRFWRPLHLDFEDEESIDTQGLSEK